MEARISIIVPVYNVEAYLALCVESLMNQSYGDFEVLLIDDGSSDSSGTLCDALKERDARIHVFHKQNGGLSDARNYGIGHAHGEFLLFIDSDDVLHPDFCRTLIELQQQYDADIVSCSLVQFYEAAQVKELNQKLYDKDVSVFYGDGILREYYSPQDASKVRIYHGLCMKLYKASLFGELRFAKGRLHEDLFITYRLLDAAECFVFVDVPYYYYFQKNTNSITKNYGEKNFRDECDALHEMEVYFRDNAAVQHALHAFMFRHYQYLLSRYQLLDEKKGVKDLADGMRHWLKAYLAEELDLSADRKIRCILHLWFPHLYAAYIRLLGLLRRGRDA